MTVAEDLQNLDTVVPRVYNYESSLLVQLYTARTVEFAVLLTTLTVLSVITEIARIDKLYNSQ